MTEQGTAVSELGIAGMGPGPGLPACWISSAAISIWTPVMWQYDRDYAIWGQVAGAGRQRGAGWEVGQNAELGGQAGGKVMRSTAGLLDAE